MLKNLGFEKMDSLDFCQEARKFIEEKLNFTWYKILETLTFKFFEINIKMRAKVRTEEQNNHPTECLAVDG